MIWKLISFTDKRLEKVNASLIVSFIFFLFISFNFRDSRTIISYRKRYFNFSYEGKTGHSCNIVIAVTLQSASEIFFLKFVCLRYARLLKFNFFNAYDLPKKGRKLFFVLKITSCFHKLIKCKSVNIIFNMPAIILHIIADIRFPNFGWRCILCTLHIKY